MKFKPSQGAMSVLFGCHSVVHSVIVLLSWRIIYKSWPVLWQIVCIFLHDIGHWGFNYLDNSEDKKFHWCLGAHYAYKLFGWKGYKFTAGHCLSSNVGPSRLRLPDKYSWTIAPTIWLWFNNVAEPKLIRPGMSRWKSGLFWKQEMKAFVKSGKYETYSAHDVYLDSLK